MDTRVACSALWLVACTADKGDDSAVMDTGPCPNYSGFHAVGDQWVRDGTSIYDDVTTELSTTTTLIAWDETTNEITAESFTTSASGDITISSNSLMYYQCTADGLYGLGNTTTQTINSAGIESTVTFSLTCEAPSLVLRRGISAGDSWDYNSTCVLLSEGSEDYFIDSGTVSVADGGEVTVEAGTFTTLTLSAGDGLVRWVDANAGEVQTLIEAEGQPTIQVQLVSTSL